MDASQATPSIRDLPVLQERHVWIVVEKQAPTEQVYRPINPGSAIVAAPLAAAPDYVKLYFEANLYWALNQHRYEERLSSCWGRLVNRYPTVAMMGMPVAEFLDQYEVIGTYDGKTMSLLEGGQQRIDEVQQAYDDFWGAKKGSAMLRP
jgi:hypothetical protein